MLGVLCALMLGVSVAGPPVEPPSVVDQIDPVYPEEAEGEDAEVLVHVNVDVKGQVVDTFVVSGPVVFHKEALSATQQLLFKPARQDGRRVAGSVVVSVPFVAPEEDADLEIDVKTRRRRRAKGTWVTCGSAPR